MTASFPLLAGVRYAKDDPVDALLEGVVRGLQAGGARVAGYIQRESDTGADCCPTTHLEDVVSGARHVISQPLGTGSKGCRLDPQALAARCGEVEGWLAGDLDLLVLNRFGKGESQGHGFRMAIERAMLDGVPVLTAVQTTYLPDWLDFAGDYATTLALSRAEVEAWARAALRHVGRPAREIAS